MSTTTGATGQVPNPLRCTPLSPKKYGNTYTDADRPMLDTLWARVDREILGGAA